MKPRNEAKEAKRVGWKEILEAWDLVVPDLAEVYGVDLYDPALKRRPWPWLRGLLMGLISTPNSRLSRHLARR